jgi:hypothetical protein
VSFGVFNYEIKSFRCFVYNSCNNQAPSEVTLGVCGRLAVVLFAKDERRNIFRPFSRKVNGPFN